jgi:hypothetical protein
MPDIFSPDTKGNGLKIASGQHTTVTASDDVETGLRKVLFASATLETDPAATASNVTAVVGDQAGAPASGRIRVKSWRSTADGANVGVHNTSPAAATTFGAKVNWVAVGY